jgi:hypothetical protein
VGCRCFGEQFNFEFSCCTTCIFQTTTHTLSPFSPNPSNATFFCGVVSFLITAGVAITCAEQDPMVVMNNKLDAMMTAHEAFVATWTKELQQTKDELSRAEDKLEKVEGELQQTKLQLKKHRHQSSDCRVKFTQPTALGAYYYMEHQPRCDGDEFMTSLMYTETAPIHVRGRNMRYEYSCCKVGVWDQ